MKYSTTYEINYHDQGYDGILRTSALQKYMQETANRQLNEYGPTNDELRKESKAFLLSRITVDIPDTVRGFDTVEGVTYACESRGYSFHRCHELKKNGSRIAYAHSVWAMVNTESRALLRVSEYHPNFTTEPMPSELPEVKYGRPNIDEMVYAGSHRVCLSETDINRHMNNTCYPDMFMDLLPHEGKRVRRYCIRYVNEAPMGETVDIYMKPEDDGMLMCSVRSDGKINAEAKFMLCGINE